MPSYDVTNYSISAEEFEQLRRIIYTRFGIHLTEKKRSLVVGRLQKLLRQKGFTTFQSYLDYLEQSGDTGLSDLINLISTNYTYFNREKDHFTFLEESVLPIVSEKLAAQNQRDLRIWCAGCSTGEEAYMLLITMMEYFGSETINAGMPVFWPQTSANGPCVLPKKGYTVPNAWKACLKNGDSAIFANAVTASLRSFPRYGKRRPFAGSTS